MPTVEKTSTFSPPFAKRGRAWRTCRTCAQRLIACDPSDVAGIEQIRTAAMEAADREANEESYILRLACSFLCDLRLHGWTFACGPARIQLIPSSPDGKEAVRDAHLRGRQQQLSTPSVRQFIYYMERKRMGPDDWVSIFSLMRDGRELADRLQEAKRSGSDSISDLQQVIRPYLQFVDDNAICQHTGFRLMDIWRYFRHTWTNEYTSVPGRTLPILVRDRNAKHHPVIGIAALASPVMQLASRDRWIGWTSAEFLESLRNGASASWARWVHDSLDQLISDVYLRDLLHEGILTTKEIKSPTANTIEQLRAFAERERDLHRQFPDRDIHKNPSVPLSDKEWQIRSRTHLFRWKRGISLSALLEARMQLLQNGFKETTKLALLTALDSAPARRAIDTIRRFTKARFVGNNILEITVCGAVAPYNELLGGKLVAMLLTSPEVCEEYARRYGKTASIIASSMAGRPIRRRPKLAVLTTTSLYGGGLNQYSRISIPATVCGGANGECIRYQKVDVTEGQGLNCFIHSETVRADC